MTNDQLVKLVVAIIMALVTIHCIKKGFRKGFLKELGSALSLMISLLCIFLIMLLYTAIKDKTYGTVIVVIAALLMIGAGVKLAKCIGNGLIGITELSVISGIDKVFGAILGFGEAALMIYVFNHIMAEIGKTSFVLDIPAMIRK